jgi:twinkle protein
MTISAVPPLPVTGLSQKHAEWLEGRGIPCEIAAEAGLKSRGEQLLFPYKLNGAPLYDKVRGSGKKFWIEPSGAPLALWGLDSLQDASSDTLIVCEGELDALSWMAAGAPAVVSVPNGAAGKPGEGDIDPLDDKRFAYLWTPDGKVLPVLEKFKRIILSTDGDEPGVILGNELAARLGPERCLRLEYPDGCKDANDVLMKHGLGGLGEMFNDAKPVIPLKLVTFSGVPEIDRPTYPVGMMLGEHLKVCPPELFIVTGAPGSGKSQFALAIAANLARLYGQRGAVLQLEDNPQRNRADLIRYAQAWRGTKKGEIDREPLAWIDEMFLTIAPYVSEDEPYTLGWLTMTLREAAITHGCKWVILDPWNEIEHLWGANETEVAYTNKALAHLKALARMLGITLFVVTHPSKGGGQKGSIEEMSLYDVSGSAAFKNKADHGVILLRPNPESPRVYVKIDKSKDHQRLGIPGIVTMEFESRSATYKFIGRGVIREQGET